MKRTDPKYPTSFELLTALATMGIPALVRPMRTYEMGQTGIIGEGAMAVDFGVTLTGGYARWAMNRLAMLLAPEGDAGPRALPSSGRRWLRPRGRSRG